MRQTDWVINNVDRYILSQLESNHMQPSAAADKRTLIRRAYYDLIGLPPTPEQILAFLNDDSSNAFSKVGNAIGF